MCTHGTILSSEFYIVIANYIVLGIYCTLNIRVYCLYSVCLLIGWSGHRCILSREDISLASTGDHWTGRNSQGFIVAKKQILLEVDGFNILEGLITLLSCYYVVYVRYPAAGTLLFLQEVVLHELPKVN